MGGLRRRSSPSRCPKKETVRSATLLVSTIKLSSWIKRKMSCSNLLLSGAHIARILHPHIRYWLSTMHSIQLRKIRLLIDAEANHFPDRDIKGYPWIKLYPADRKNDPINYFGPEELEAMRDLIRDNGKHRAEIKLEEAAAQ